jgi:hypothetical protein
MSGDGKEYLRGDLFSIAYQTMIPSAAVMIQPVTPGPVAKLASKKPTTPLDVVATEARNQSNLLSRHRSER